MVATHRRVRFLAGYRPYPILSLHGARLFPFRLIVFVFYHFDCIESDAALASLPVDAVVGRFFDPTDVDGSAMRIARFLMFNDSFHLASDQVVALMYFDGRVHFDLRTIARALFSEHGCDLRPENVACALLSLHGLETVAWVLHSEGGLGLSTGEVAQALFSIDGPHVPPFDIARALCSERGCGLSGLDAGRVLVSPDGLGLAPKDVAFALASAQGANLPPASLVSVLSAVLDHDLSLPHVTAFLARDVYVSHQQRAELFEALVRHSRCEHPLPTLAYAFLSPDAPVLAPVDVARFLYDKDGLDIPPQTIVYTFTHRTGPHLPLPLVARLLHSENGLHLPFSVAYDALRFGAGLSEQQALTLLENTLDTPDCDVPMLDRSEASASATLLPKAGPSRV